MVGLLDERGLLQKSSQLRGEVEARSAMVSRLVSSRTCPVYVSTFRIGLRGTLTPELAKTPKATAMSIMRTSPPPRVSERPKRSGLSQPVMPMAEAVAIIASRPLRASCLTAGML